MKPDINRYEGNTDKKKKTCTHTFHNFVAVPQFWKIQDYTLGMQHHVIQ